VSIQIGVRAATPEDLYFVRASWFRSFWDHDPFHSSYADYEAHMPDIIRGLLERTPCTVAFFTTAPTEVLAWVCRTDDTLVWAYTKNAYRKQGLQARLTNGVKEFSLRPKLSAGRALVRKLHYNPWPLLRKT
jgi:hypothetical protein